MSPELVQKLNSYFTGQQYITAVYVFGSTVKGKNRGDSDLDLAVLFEPGPDPLRRFDAKLQMTLELEDLLKTKVDVVDLRSADLFFIHQVMLHKLLVFDKKTNDRVAFEVKSRREFFDRQHFYDLYHGRPEKDCGRGNLTNTSPLPSVQPPSV